MEGYLEGLRFILEEKFSSARSSLERSLSKTDPSQVLLGKEIVESLDDIKILMAIEHLQKGFVHISGGEEKEGKKEIELAREIEKDYTDEIKLKHLEILAEKTRVGAAEAIFFDLRRNSS